MGKKRIAKRTTRKLTAAEKKRVAKARQEAEEDKDYIISLTDCPSFVAAV